jgi:hypothetical protein
MELFFLGLILIAIVAFFAYKDSKNLELLQTVTDADRGTRSEQDMVLKLLKSGIKPTAIFHDIYFYKGNGHYCQIDLVVATKVGIIVFEVKDYSGWIFGGAKQEYWTQVLAYGDEKYKFYNPILQNKKHIEDLKKNYDFVNLPIYSLIVFFGDCNFKNSIKLPEHTYLTYASSAMEVFNGIIKNNPVYQYENQRVIANFLKQAVKNGEKSEIRNKHIENIKKYKMNSGRFD